MPPKQTMPSMQASSASQMQAEAPMDPLMETEDYEGLDDSADVAQLREQIHTLTQAHKDDQQTLKLILEQLATLAAAQAAQQNVVRTVEHVNAAITGSQDRTPKYSKKQPDPNPLSDRTDPTFESWRLQ